MIPDDRLMTVSSALQGGFAKDTLSALTAFSVPAVPSWIADMTAITPGFGLSVEKLGVDTKKLMDSSCGSLFAGVDLYGDTFRSSLEQLGIDTLASLDKPLVGLDSFLDPSLDMGNLFEADLAFENALAALGASVASSIDTGYVQDLIGLADVFRSEIEALDIDERAAELFTAHPGLAESIEQQSFLINLSPAERKLIVWFIGTIVAIYVTMGVANISLDSEELGALLSGLGIAGPPAGVVAGKVTGKLLDKLPQADES
jgi:hypothetical protein